jgi:hypothetical protein
MWKSASRAPSLRVFTLAFALQLRKTHGKTSQCKRNLSQVNKNLRVQYTYYQDTHTLQNRHKHTHYKTHTHTHTLQNNIKPQYKLKQSTRSTQIKYNIHKIITIQKITTIQKIKSTITTRPLKASNNTQEILEFYQMNKR